MTCYRLCLVLKYVMEPSIYAMDQPFDSQLRISWLFFEIRRSRVLMYDDDSKIACAPLFFILLVEEQPFRGSLPLRHSSFLCSY